MLGGSLVLLALTIALRPPEVVVRPYRTLPPARLGAPALLPSARTVLGVNLNVPFLDPSFSGREMLHVRAAAAHGVRVARSDALWANAEPVSPGMHSRREFDWSRTDRIAGFYARAGIRWWPILDYSTSWAAADWRLLHSPPRDGNDFALYARAFAARYGRGGRFWRANPRLPRLPVTDYEIWNEPSSGAFWQPRPDAAAYLDLYLRARNQIKAKDPAARVIVGGLTPDLGYLEDLLRARRGVAAHLDGIGLHPYGTTPAKVMDHVRDVRRTLARLGAGAVPLYLTEYGWQDSPRTGRYYAPPALKAANITASVLDLERSECGVAAIFLYSWTTPERDPQNIDDWYGIYAPGGGERPASLALGALLRQDPARTRVQPRTAPVADC